MPKPVLRPPPKATLNPYSRMQLGSETCTGERSAEASEKRQSARRRRSDGRTLYIAASFSFRVAFETPARPGWTTSTSCAGQTKAQADERSASLKSHRSRSRGQAGSVRIAAAATGGW